MDTAADILGVQNTPVDLASNPQATATIPMQDPGQTVDVTTPPPSGVQPGADPATAMVQAQPNPAYQDPEIAMGAAHHNWLGKILDEVGTILGGDKTIVATKHPDGSVSVEHNPSTTGEKWGRVAAAALGGAAKGMAAGQGPGGAGKAFAAGAENGLAANQQRLDAANAEAANMSAQQTRNAQNARLNQIITQNGWDISHLSRDDQQKQEDISLDHAKKLSDMGAMPVAMNVKDGATLAKYGVANPLAVGAHVGANGDMIYNESDGKGGVNFYQIPAAVANQATKTDDSWEEIKVDPKDPTKTVIIPHVTLAGQDRNGERFTRHMAQNVANDAALKQAQQASVAQQGANTKAQEAQIKATELTQKAPLIRAQTAEAGSSAALQGARAEQVRRSLTNQPGGEPVEVEDPNFPNPTNFPVGTLGIAKPPKTGDYKVPADADTAYRLSTIMRDSGNQIRQIATANPQLFGRLQGLLSQGKTVVGLSNSPDDQAIASLAGSIQQYAQASAGFHKFRNKAAPAETEESSLNKFRNDPASIVAFLDSQKPALDQTDKLIRNYQVYGTAQGPSPEARAAAVARAPNAAKFQGGGSGPATQSTGGNTNQAARAGGNVVPAGATPGRDPKGNIIGYKTADGREVRF